MSCKVMVLSQLNVYIYKGEIRESDITLQVMNGKNLLGRADIARLGLVIRVNAAETNLSCKTVVNDYKDVLGSCIGCMHGEYDARIADTVTSVVQPPRSVPVLAMVAYVTKFFPKVSDFV